MTIETARARVNSAKVARREGSRSNLKEITEALGLLETDNMRLTEALGNVQMMIDAQGWSPVFGHSEDGGLDLATLKQASAQTRELVVGNPFVKQASHLRNVGIWGEGVEFSEVTAKKQKPLAARVRALMKKPANRRYLFSADAQEELERAAFTDGSVFLLFDTSAQTFMRVPLTEITADWRNPDNSEEVWAYRREWRKNISQPREAANNRLVRWYYTDLYEGARRGSLSYNGTFETVDRQKTLVDKTFNRQTGWAYGVPDALPVLAWSKLYKEFLVNGYVMSRALAQIAYKVTGNNERGRQQAAVEVSRPGRGGNTASLGAGNDLLPLQTAGRGYDFDSGRPLAAAIAAGAQVSLNALLADPDDKDARMDRATAMLRRRSWEDFWSRIFDLLGVVGEVKVTWHDIREEQLQRVLQSWVLLNSTGLFEGEPIQKGLADAIGMADPGEIPKGYMLPNNSESLARKDVDTDGTGADRTGSGAPTDQDDPDQGRMPAAGSGQGKDSPAGGLGNSHDNDMK